MNEGLVCETSTGDLVTEFCNVTNCTKTSCVGGWTQWSECYAYSQFRSYVVHVPQANNGSCLQLAGTLEVQDCVMNSISKGGIAGAVVGGVFGLLLLAAIVVAIVALVVTKSGGFGGERA